MADFKYKSTSEFKTHHRSYNNILPSSNKILARKYDQARYEAHRKRVSGQKASIDNSAPKPYMHLHVKLKKLQTEEERLAVIERDNRMLLEKMSHIMRTQGQVDHRNYYEHKSLNYEQRHEELMRITRENQKILQRIQHRQPIIDAAELDAEYAQSKVYGDSLTRYPALSPIKATRRMTEGSEAESDFDATPEPAAEPEPEAASEPEAEAKADAEPEAEAEKEPEVDAE
jgi:hypothetical protein